MDHITLLTTQDLENLLGKKIIIIGSMTTAKMLYKVFCFLKIDVIGISNNDVRRRKYYRVPIIKSSELNKIVQQNDNVMLQFSEIDISEAEQIKKSLMGLNLEYSKFSFGRILFSFYPSIYFASLKNPFRFIYEYLGWRISTMQTGNRKTLRCRFARKKENILIIALPPKTADVTITATLSNLSHLNFINIWHRIKFVNGVMKKKKGCENKILTAVREPISQNLSGTYQRLSIGSDTRNWFFGYLQNTKIKNKYMFLKRIKQLISCDRGNVQVMFEEYIKRYVYPEKNLEYISTHPRSMQCFAKEFNEVVFNYMAYPFDTEKGYAIVKEGNTEVFVYQLEKLNSLVPELSEWIGVPFDKLEKGNVAADKWLAESYKQAQEEIEITQEYFDKCFDEPYVKHCYSAADIEKFKARWRSHIKKGAQ